MNDWILIVPMVASALLAAAGWLVAWSMHRELEAAYECSYAAQEVARKLSEANRQLYAENADLREEVAERRAEVGNLTVELDKAQATPKARPVHVKTYGVPVKKVEDVQ